MDGQAADGQYEQESSHILNLTLQNEGVKLKLNKTGETTRGNKQSNTQINQKMLGGYLCRELTSIEDDRWFPNQNLKLTPNLNVL